MRRTRKKIISDTKKSPLQSKQRENYTNIQPNESHIASLLRANDPLALVELSKYAGRLEIILRRKFIAAIPLEDIKDIIAETLIIAYQRGREYNPELSNIMTWLSMLAHFRALKFLRDHQVFTNQALDDLAETMAKHIEQDRPFTKEQPSIKLASALQRLPPQRAKAIRLHYYEGLSFDQIADLLRITISGVKSLLSRGRSDLRTLLNGENEEV